MPRSKFRNLPRRLELSSSLNDRAGEAQKKKDSATASKAEQPDTPSPPRYGGALIGLTGVLHKPNRLPVPLVASRLQWADVQAYLDGGYEPEWLGRHCCFCKCPLHFEHFFPYQCTGAPTYAETVMPNGFMPRVSYDEQFLTKAFYADRTLCRQFHGLYDRMSKVKMSEMSFPPLNRIL